MILFNVLETRISDLVLGHFLCNNFPSHSVETFLLRHARGDWGTVNGEIKCTNQMALREGGRVISRFPIGEFDLVIQSTVEAGFARSRMNVQHTSEHTAVSA